MTRFDIINKFIKENNLLNYLEIGVFDGECIRQVIAPHKDGVDPGSEGKVAPEVNFKMTSDEFFELIKGKDIKYDIVFIDGLHHSEQVDKDITNSLENLTDEGIIVLHDCNPPTEGHAAVPRQQGEWNGDVYKSILKIRYQNIFDCFVIDADWGCGVIRKGSIPENNISIIEYKKGISDWVYFHNNRKKLLNLITTDEFCTNRS